MLDHFHLPTPNGAAEVFYFEGAIASGTNWRTWQKPRGKSMVHILLVGPGGNGGNGSVGTTLTSAGGGGGASGGQTAILIPAHFLPDILFLQMQGPGANPAIVSVAPNTTNNNVLARGSQGGSGGNASGAMAGTGGTLPSPATAANMPLGWQFRQSVLGGMAGTAGGATSIGVTTALPTTGLLITGGTGGGGIQNWGGDLQAAGVFPANSGGEAAPNTTTPGRPGSPGYRPIAGLLYGYGGTGGGGSSDAATGAGLFGGNGGPGAPGCGGGGGGGCLIDGVAGVGGDGGPSFCLITCW